MKVVQYVLFFTNWPARYRDKHSITLLPAYMPTHSFQCGDQLSVMGPAASRVASSFSYCQSSFSPLGSTRGGPVGILPYHSMPALLHLRNSITPGGLGVECLHPPIVSCVYPPPAIVLLVLTKHVASQFRLLILVAPC